MRPHRLALLVAALATCGAVAASVALAGATHQSALVNWHAQQMHPAGTGNTGQVSGAQGNIVRTENGISYRLQTTGLVPGRAYTLWLVTIDNPSACNPKPCTAPDIINNAATDSQVGYAGGHVAGGSGQGSFAGHVSVGPVSGWLANRSLDNPLGAEVHLVVNDHGPALSAFMPSMIHTYRGGCADSSPFPGVFPPSALADGDNAGPGGSDGPNTCLLYQAAIFSP